MTVRAPHDLILHHDRASAGNGHAALDRCRIARVRPRQIDNRERKGLAEISPHHSGGSGGILQMIVQYQCVVGSIVQSKILPAFSVPATIPISGQIIIIRAQVRGPSNPGAVENKRSEVEVGMIILTAAALHSEKQSIRIIPAGSHRDEFRSSKVSTWCECGKQLGKRLIPHQVKRMGAVAQLEQAMVLGNAVGKIELFPQPKKNRAWADLAVAIAKIEIFALSAGRM